MKELRGQLIKHYRILNQIGAGGMGLVYKAEDSKLKRLVALKFLPEDLHLQQTAKDRFLQEARIVSALDHPNICSIYDFDETSDGRLFIVMPYYSGEALDVMLRKGPIGLTRAINLVGQIAEGLAKAHARGIVHRDIKPSNIIITHDGVVKIIDFGLAKLLEQNLPPVREGSVGTIAYMSPEQLSDMPVDDRTDIWSLGLVFYEMLAGENPYSGEYNQAIIYGILNEDPQNIKEFLPDVSDELTGILDRALAKSPNDRYQHILDFVADLKKIDKSYPTADATPAASAKRINPLRSGLVLLSLIVIVFLVWRIFTSSDDQNVLTILPFKKSDNLIQSQYYTLGITEGIVQKISTNKTIEIRPWQLSLNYIDYNQSLKEIHDQIGGRYYLTGSIAEKNDSLFLMAQLTDVVKNKLLFAREYRTTVNDVYGLQNVVARAIVQILGTEPDKFAVAELFSKDLLAYDMYLKGREYYYRYTREANESAIRLFKEALIRDEGFAMARAGLADAFCQRTLRFGMATDWLDSATVQCNLAREDEPELAEPFKALALTYYTRSWFKKAREANLEALKRNPNFAPALANLGWICLQQGDLPEAAKYLNKAHYLNPLNPNINLALGYMEAINSNEEIALRWIQHAYRLQPDHKPNPLILIQMLKITHPGLAIPDSIMFENGLTMKDESLFLAYGDRSLTEGDMQKALQYYQEALAKNSQAWHPFTGINVTTSLGFVLWKQDMRPQAEVLFQLSLEQDAIAKSRGNEWWGIEYDRAAVLAITGREDEAIESLLNAVEFGFRHTDWLAKDPLLESLKYSREIKKVQEDIKIKLNRK